MKSLITILIAVGVSAILWACAALGVMYLWNWLMPDIFGLKEITYQQSLGLILLCNILAGSTHTFELRKDRE